jgi:hypothetical protein
MENNATAISSDPCATVHCNSSNPICIVKAGGSAQCVKDACVDTVCTADTTCQVDSSTGDAVCVLTVIAPVPVCQFACRKGYICVNGECVPQSTCANVKCASDTPICVNSETEGPTCVEDVCKDKTCADGEVCFGRQVQCTQAPCPPIAECMKNPCIDLVCDAASTCEIDLQGNAFCLPLPGNPGDPDVSCAAVTCDVDTPVCITKDDGSAECVKDACLDTFCTADSTCQVDSKGNATCVPLVVMENNATAISSDPCATVHCNSSNPICIVKAGGSAQCVKDACVDTVCTADTTCQVDSSTGDAVCVLTVHCTCASLPICL